MSDAPADLTVRILQEIRGELREIKDQQRSFQDQQRSFQDQQRSFQEQTMARFEVIETALRDLAQQLVVLGRGVKVAIEERTAADGRLEDHEQRIARLEASR